jgi:hypothetical protein
VGVRIKLPAGFVVVEIPEAAKLQTAFGSYATSYAVKDDLLIFTRVLKVQAGLLPVEQYGPVKEFFEQIAGAEQAPVVLARK